MATDQIKPFFFFTSLGTPGLLRAALGLSELNKLPRANGEVGIEGRPQRMGVEKKASLIRVGVTIP